MSLACDETGKDIMYGDPLYAGTRRDSKIFSALSQEVIDKIPQEERRAQACAPEDGGVDIHAASSGRNFNGAYSWKEFELGDFLFSISKQTLMRHLPRHARHYERSTDWN